MCNIENLHLARRAESQTRTAFEEQTVADTGCENTSVFFNRQGSIADVVDLLTVHVPGKREAIDRHKASVQRHAVASADEFVVLHLVTGMSGIQRLEFCRIAPYELDHAGAVAF